MSKYDLLYFVGVFVSVVIGIVLVPLFLHPSLPIRVITAICYIVILIIYFYSIHRMIEHLKVGE